MQTYRFVRSDGAEFIFSNVKGSSIGVIDVSGLSSAPINASTVSGINQHGVTVTRLSLGARSITFSLDLRAGSSEKNKNARKNLLAFFNPLSTYRLYVNEEYYLDVRMSIGFNLSEKELPFIGFGVTFVADNPFIQKAAETVRIGTEIPMKTYPFVYEDTIIYSISAEEMEIIVNGAADTSPTIRFYGPATQPYVENSATGQRITINTEIPEGAYLEIVSGYGKKSVKLHLADGTVQNAFSKIAEGSEFITLQAGYNFLTYGAETMSAQAGAEVSYNEYYSNI